MGATETSTNGLIAKESYYPFGATRSTTGTIPTDRLFTGQRQEPIDALGLYNYGAQFYSTAVGRFMSVDPVVGHASNPQSWNSYSYVGNNPLRYTDPTGKKRDDQVDLEQEEYKARRDHDDLVATLQYFYQLNAVAAAWRDSQSIQNADPGLGTIQPDAPKDDGGGDGFFSNVVDIAEGVAKPLALEGAETGSLIGLVGPGILVAEIVGAALLSPCDSMGCTRRPVVIGQSMKRVAPLAAALHAETFDPEGIGYLGHDDRTAGLKVANEMWIRAVMDAGRPIYDIGTDPPRAAKGDISPFYEMEQRVTSDYWNLHVVEMNGQ